KDTFSKSDPREWPGGRGFGRTEVIDNTLNPDFVRKFILDYFFEEKQNLGRARRCPRGAAEAVSPQDFLGQAFCTLGEIVGSAGSRLENPGRGPHPVPGPQDVATLQFCANKLDKKDFFGKSDPFMVFYRSNEDGTFTICHKTEVVRNTLNPVWQAFAIPVRALCNGDYDRTSRGDRGSGCPARWHRARVPRAGDAALLRRRVRLHLPGLHQGRVSGAGRGHSCPPRPGALVTLVPSTQINFTVAIDFTASNGNPSQSTSLHYMSPYQLNAYTMALRAVGEIIQDYDSDKMFPALGFGAKIPPDGTSCCSSSPTASSPTWRRPRRPSST
uniref:Copine 5 n=1 Tax=Nothoprocta perdicaria TaxID=30464 RepID=A0A8C7EDI1_NOTPE